MQAASDARLRARLGRLVVGGPRLRWLAGALVLLAPWPYTLLVIKPVNDQLKAADPDGAGAQSRALIERWGRLHAGRTALGVLATAIFFLRGDGG